MIRMLVTGVEGDLGQSIVKALRLSSLNLEVHGCDAAAPCLGPRFVRTCSRVPAAREAEAYVAALDDLCRRLGVVAVIPSSEPEIRTLCRLASLRLPCGAAVVCLGLRAVETFGDKLACMRSLRGKVPLAPFADGADAEAVGRLVAEAGYPLVVKPRTSSGSRNLRITQDRHQLDAARESLPDSIVQAYLDADGGEFSVGVFCCPDFEAVIAFRRELGPAGCSWFAETSTDAAVLAYTRTISGACAIEGSFNVQVRKTAVGLRLLEINPRFSSLVAARAACGFADVEWSLRLALGLQLPQPPPSWRSLRFRRFFHEMLDWGDGFRPFPKWSA